MNSDLTQFLAAYGALVSTGSVIVAFASLALSAYVIRRDRAHVRLRGVVMLGLTYSRGVVAEDLPPFVQLTVSNKGRRPITIKQAGWSLANGTHVTIAIDPFAEATPALHEPDLPCTLEESKSCEFRWPLGHFAENAPVRFSVTDAHNDKHFMAWRANRKLRKQIKAVLAGKSR